MSDMWRSPVRAEEVQELGLGHRDGDLEELRLVAGRQALHERS
jgi:hypothetical protein